MSETMASMLRFSIAFALRRVRVQIGRGFRPLALTEEQRYEVADITVAELRTSGWARARSPNYDQGSNYCADQPKSWESVSNNGTG
jgi:hypothetical protein